jgi:hypothetical protein
MLQRLGEEWILARYPLLVGFLPVIIFSCFYLPEFLLSSQRQLRTEQLELRDQ